MDDKDDPRFRQPGGRIGSYHGSAFNQFKRLSQIGAITPKFHFAMFKAFLTDMATRYAAGEKETDLAADVHVALAREELVPELTLKIHVLRWIHDYILFLKGETEFACPENLQHLLPDSSGKPPQTDSEKNTEKDKNA